MTTRSDYSAVYHADIFSRQIHIKKQITVNKQRLRDFDKLQVLAGLHRCTKPYQHYPLLLWCGLLWTTAPKSILDYTDSLRKLVYFHLMAQDSTGCTRPGQVQFVFNTMQIHPQTGFVVWPRNLRSALLPLSCTCLYHKTERP